MYKKNRDYILFIEDIIDSINKIERYVNGLSFEDFIDNEMIIDAVIRNFEVIGEAVINLPEYIKNKYPNVEWKEAKGFRNVMIHNYFGVDKESVWDTIKSDIPNFKRNIIKVLKTEKKKSK